MSEREILLVEDNPDDVELTLLAFGKANIANPVVVAKDGVQALDYLFGTGAYSARDTSRQPLLVLLDLKLPRLGGLEVLQRLRQDPRTKRLAVVVLTTSSEQDDIMRTYDLHANSYVRKPVDFTQFAEAVQQLGLYWLLLNEPAPPVRR